MYKATVALDYLTIKPRFGWFRLALVESKCWSSLKLLAVLLALEVEYFPGVILYIQYPEGVSGDKHRQILTYFVPVFRDGKGCLIVLMTSTREIPTEHDCRSVEICVRNCAEIL